MLVLEFYVFLEQRNPCFLTKGPGVAVTPKRKISKKKKQQNTVIVLFGEGGICLSRDVTANLSLSREQITHVLQQ